MPWLESITPKYQGNASKQTTMASAASCFSWLGNLLKTPTPTYKTLYVEPVSGNKPSKSKRKR